MTILELDLDLTHEDARDFGLNNFDQNSNVYQRVKFFQTHILEMSLKTQIYEAIGTWVRGRLQCCSQSQYMIQKS